MKLVNDVHPKKVQADAAQAAAGSGLLSAFAASQVQFVTMHHKP